MSTPLAVLGQINPQDRCIPKLEPVTQDHHRQTNVLKGSARFKQVGG